MPLQRCTKNGKKGWQYGDSGYCYTGDDAKTKAKQQMAAMYASGYKGEKKENK